MSVRLDHGEDTLDEVHEINRYAPRARVRALWGLSGWRGNERIGKL
jgi:hypothetical protein